MGRYKLPRAFRNNSTRNKWNSVHFNTTINISHKFERRKESHRTECQEKGVTSDKDGWKEFDSLKEARHVGTTEIIKRGVQKDENAGRSCRKNGSPPPFVIFDGQLEIRQCDGHCRCYAEDDYERQTQNAVESVRLPTPQSGKDVIQFHRDGTKRQESTNQVVHHPRAVPRRVWYLPWYVFGTAGCIKITCGILAKNSAQNS